MLVAAAVCPHPPLLVPEATGAAGKPALDRSAGRPGLGPADLELAVLREACIQALSRLLATGPDLLVVVGAADRSVAFPADAAGSLQRYGVPWRTGTGKPVLPLSLTVGAWLLRERAGDGDPRDIPKTLLQGVWHALPATGCLELGGRLGMAAPRIAMLVMGDGPARRAAGPPGAADPAADAYDKEVEAAFATADADRLAALEPADDTELMVAGRAAWQVLAGAARLREDRGLRGEILYSGIPLEVSYLVAFWESAGRR